MLARVIAAAIGRYYSDAMHAEAIAQLRAAYGAPCDPSQSPAASVPSDPSPASKRG